MSYAAAAKALIAARSVTLTTHLGPDGDGIGSCLALYHALKRLGKTVRFVAPSKVSAVYTFLPGFAKMTIADDAESAARIPRADVVLSCDCGDLPRLGACGTLKRGTLINLDHHATNDRFGDINLVDIAAASSGVVVEKVLRRLGTVIDRTIAECLYTTIVFDTGRFMHSNTTAEVLRWSAALLATGIDAAAINRKLTYTKTLGELKAQALAINCLRRDADPRLAGIAISLADVATISEPDDWGDLVEIPRSLAGVEVAYVLREKRTKEGAIITRASLRANPPFVVSDTAQAFGGGGHAQAAGCTIKAPLIEALPQIEERLRAAVQVKHKPKQQSVVEKRTPKAKRTTISKRSLTAQRKPVAAPPAAKKMRAR